jgi:hypothetical protein
MPEARSYPRNPICKSAGSRAGYCTRAGQPGNLQRALWRSGGERVAELFRPEKGEVHVFFDCAIADVLPTPEDYWPSGADIISDRTDNLKAECEWNHSDGTHVEVFAIRHLPRLPRDDLYPVVKAANQVPTHSTLLFA